MPESDESRGNQTQTTEKAKQTVTMFKKVFPDYRWEIGVEDNSGSWEHYHPTAPTEESARLKAIHLAERDDFEEPSIYMCEGPYE